MKNKSKIDDSIFYKNIKEHSKSIIKADISDEVIYYEKCYDNHTYMTYMNQINNEKIYEVYLVIRNNKKIASPLLYKKFKKKLLALVYYRFLLVLAKGHKLKMIISLQNKYQKNTNKELK